jgi:hypothetical protein
MTVGMNTWECLQTFNDSNGTSASSVASTNAVLSTISTISSSTTSSSSTNNTQYPTNSKNKVEQYEPVTVSSATSQPVLESSNSNSNSNNQNTSTNAHSLGSLKKARSGRNHAGAKYLASQYTQGKNYGLFNQLFEYLKYCISNYLS